MSRQRKEEDSIYIPFTFIDEVKEAFQGRNREEYDEFLRILIDYELERINNDQMIGKTIGVLRGHTNLRLKFSTFLPEYKEALEFVTDVKETFSNDNVKYQEFLLHTNDFRGDRIGRDEFVVKIKDLFRDHPELILRFQTFC